MSEGYLMRENRYFYVCSVSIEMGLTKVGLPVGRIRGSDMKA